ncbi:MAG: RNA polymerase factor sigma-54, partial [Methylotetracoccus sp.]|nr:RNA polymerase factor sigma-54 [Methylotetracoccus sp.]
MKQTLQLRLGQQLTMTPQLQQAIKLLQLSTLDLHQEIQQALDSNMMLEVTEDEAPFADAAENARSESSSTEFKELPDLDQTSEIPAELPMDSSWDEVYEGLQTYGSVSTDSDNDDFSFQRAKAESLQDHLRWQLDLSPLSDRDNAIGMAIIDAVNDDGYLDSPIEDIFQSLRSQIEDLDIEEVSGMVHRIQNFDPPGVAASTLAECLHIQLRQMPESTPYRGKALELVKNHLDFLAKKDFARLRRALDLPDDELARVIA